MANTPKSPVTVNGLGPLDQPTGQLLTWVDQRFPLMANWRGHMSEYYAPKNFNFWYFFGSLAILVLVIQLVSGIFLAMHYKPDAEKAFESVEYIMREVPWGWLMRNMHSTGASMFFLVVYLHMFRGLLYGSYRKPRELVWIIGVAIFLTLMGEAFFGYLLPWGQMSYWGAQVIVNLYGALPIIGPDLSLWIRGDYVVSDATLNRFFAMHVIGLPLALLGLVGAHIAALHEVGSGNPDGIEIKEKKSPEGIPLDGIPFHPYYTLGHDVFTAVLFLIVFFAIVFFAPDMGGYFLEANNFVPADPLKTPSHIAPVWYFTPYYSILRGITANIIPVLGVGVILYAALIIKSIHCGYRRSLVAVIAAMILGGFYLLDAKVWGVVLMGLSTTIFFILPWLDRCPVKSIRYRPTFHKYLYAGFVVAFLVLGYLGVLPPSPAGELISQIFLVYYFAFFLLMPWWSEMGQCAPVPDRVQ